MNSLAEKAQSLMQPKPSLSQSVDATLLHSLLSDVYDLPSPIACEAYASGLNDIFEIKADAFHAMLKVYRRGWRTREEVLDEIAVLFHLHEKGVSVALPIPSRSGQYVWTIDERQIVLFSFASGLENDTNDVSSYYFSGQTLAKIHNATSDFKNARLKYDTERQLVQPMVHIASFLGNQSEDFRYLEALIARIQRYIDNPPKFTFDWGYCHGDFRCANMRWDEANRTLTVFDFELGGIGYRAYDLAYMLTNLHPVVMERLWGAPRIDNFSARWNAFLQGYDEERPLRAEVIAAIPYFVAMRPINIMGYLLETAQTKQNDETWPPSQAGGLPGGDLFFRCITFLRVWGEMHLSASS